MCFSAIDFSGVHSTPYEELDESPEEETARIPLRQQERFQNSRSSSTSSTGSNNGSINNEPVPPLHRFSWIHPEQPSRSKSVRSAFTTDHHEPVESTELSVEPALTRHSSKEDLINDGTTITSSSVAIPHPSESVLSRHVFPGRRRRPIDREMPVEDNFSTASAGRTDIMWSIYYVCVCLCVHVCVCVCMGVFVGACVCVCVFL